MSGSRPGSCCKTAPAEPKHQLRVGQAAGLLRALLINHSDETRAASGGGPPGPPSGAQGGTWIAQSLSISWGLEQGQPDGQPTLWPGECAPVAICETPGARSKRDSEKFMYALDTGVCGWLDELHHEHHATPEVLRVEVYHGYRSYTSNCWSHRRTRCSWPWQSDDRKWLFTLRSLGQQNFFFFFSSLEIDEHFFVRSPLQCKASWWETRCNDFFVKRRRPHAGEFVTLHHHEEVSYAIQDLCTRSSGQNIVHNGSPRWDCKQKTRN
jgi:hypothetical protein